jgi:ketosteroid isomerase-like protein
MATNDNAQTLEQAFRTWHDSKGKRADVWLDLMAEDVRFRSLAGGAPEAEFTIECRSRADVARYFEGLAHGWEMIHYTTSVFAADGDRVVMLGSTAWRNRQTQKVVDTPKADLVTLRGGRIVEFSEFYDTSKLLAATT